MAGEKRRGLGKGLGALFGDVVEDVSAEKKHANQQENVEKPVINNKDLEMVLPQRHNSVSSGKNENKKDSKKVTNNVPDSVKRNHNEKSNAGKKSGNQTVANNEKSVHTENMSDTKDYINMEADQVVAAEVKIKITEIEPNVNQPRQDFNEEELQELAESIKQFGILQPLLVQKKGKYYEIIAGERRWRAAKLAGLKEVPVLIREYTKQETMEIALIENVQRSDLNPIEEALAYQQLIDEFGLKQEEIAGRVAKSRVSITNSMRLLKLAPEIQKMLIKEEISSGHARAILGLEDQELQLQVAQKVIDQRLSVREVEKLVKLLSKPAKKKPEKEEEEKDISFVFQNLEDRMKSIMGTKVSINKKDKNKGRIEIEYYSSAELERIVELIESIGTETMQ